MNIYYAEKIFHNSHLTQIINNQDHESAFNNFQNYWFSTPDITSLFEENIFKQTIALNLNIFNNQLIHDFIINQAKIFLKDNFQQFQKDILDTIFEVAIQQENIDNIKLYLPENVDISNCLQISIKYNCWKSFTWFLNQYISPKQQSKIIQWTHKEFWKYRNSGYTSFEFLQQLVRHPLSENKPVKQGIYNLISDKNFEFVTELIMDDKCFPLLRDINISHYYKLLLKKLSESRSESQFTEGITLLQQSIQSIPFDFSTDLLDSTFKKNNPDIIQLIEKFQLKQKLDLLPKKQVGKKFKL